MQRTKKQAQTDMLLHKTACIPSITKALKCQRAGQLRGIFEMLKLIDSSPYQQQPAATRLRYLTYYTTLSSQPKKRNILLVPSSVGYLRLARPSSKITAASIRMSSRLVRSTPCFLYNKDSRIKSSKRATESLLRARAIHSRGVIVD